MLILCLAAVTHRSDSAQIAPAICLDVYEVTPALDGHFVLTKLFFSVLSLIAQTVILSCTK